MSLEGKQIDAPLRIAPSVCPHDCTSTCALDVEILDGRTIGRVRGSQRNAYTAGVICEKVARYAERVHHPDRLTHPLLRNGRKGSKQWRRISWDEALDRVAEAFIDTAARHGTETVWPYFYAGTMGLVQRDGINRLRHAMKYSRWHSTICVALSDSGWIAGVGRSVWEIMDATLRKSGMWDAQTNYERGGQDFAYPFERMHFLDGFDTPDRKFHFRADWQRSGGRWQDMPPLPDHFDVIDNATPEKPFRLVAAPARTFLNSTFTETPGSLKRERRPTALIHPQDCTALGVVEGDRVQLGNERGEVIVHVKPQDGQQRGVVVVEGVWPSRYFENGLGINALTGADPGWPNGGAAFHDTAVWVRRRG